jgi:hypothetical protein
VTYYSLDCCHLSFQTSKHDSSSSDVLFLKIHSLLLEEGCQMYICTLFGTEPSGESSNIVMT